MRVSVGKKEGYDEVLYEAHRRGGESRTGVVIQTIPSRKEFPAAACYYPSAPWTGLERVACTRLYPRFVP